MRHSAELVVKYLPGLAADTDGIQWAGVFKPVAEVDDSFSRSEPPAHDDWVPNSIPSKSKARDVRIALNRIKDAVTDFVLPLDQAFQADGDTSVAGIADALSDLIPTLEGPRATPRPATPAALGTKRPKAKVRTYRVGPALDGRRSTAFNIYVDGARGPTAVRATCEVGVDGGSDSSPEDVYLAGWHDSEPVLDGELGEAGADLHTIPVEGAWLVVSARDDLAVDLQVEVGGD
jgi:hypothetical protein